MPEQQIPSIDTGLCPACGTPNQCAIAAGADPAACWCMAIEPLALPPLEPGSACYCPRCLRRIAQPQN